MFGASSKPRRSSASSHGIYQRPSQSRSTGSLPAFSTFSSSRSRGSPATTRSRSAWFPSFGSSSSSSSYYKRRPRDGYIQALIAKIKRLLRDLYNYVRKNPVKALLPIVMALVSSGVLAKLAASVGWKLPQAVTGLVGAGQSMRGGYDAWYGSQNAPRGQSDWGGEGTSNLLKGAVKVASAFL